MLSILTKNGRVSRINFGDFFPSNKTTVILEVRADGEELDHLLKLFPDLPRICMETRIYVGPWAQLIGANLQGKIFSKHVFY